MDLHTWTFAIFFAFVYTAFLAVKRTRLTTAWLLAASYVFYGWLNPVYVLLIFYLTVVDYLAAVGMADAQHRQPAAAYFAGKWCNPLCWLFVLFSAVMSLPAALRLCGKGSKRPWLLLSIVNGLGMLALFKYSGFVTESLNGLLRWLHLPYYVPAANATFLSDGLNALLRLLALPYAVPRLDLLPVAMSFYVFSSLTYTIDCFRGTCQRETSFLRYAAFVAFFPKLVMGPIERARSLLPQLGEKPRITRQDVADGLSLFVVGLFKKRALADALALYVNQVYDAPGQYRAPALILASFAFAWQIYFDFSGYSDMARGVARLLGIRLMLNFNNPYLATGLGDFWRRWHISLSTWFRDYVYIPLGGSRKGEFRTYVNLWVVMLISGLWHFPKWTYVIWGAVHALGYTLTRRLERAPFYQERVPKVAKQLLTFSIVTLAWVFFKAESASDAWLILTRIFTSGWADPQFPLLLLFVVLAVWLYQFAYESKFRPLLTLPAVRVGLVVLMVLYLAVFSGSSQKFIYNQF